MFEYADGEIVGLTANGVWVGILVVYLIVGLVMATIFSMDGDLEEGMIEIIVPFTLLCSIITIMIMMIVIVIALLSMISIKFVAFVVGVIVGTVTVITIGRIIGSYLRNL